MWLSCSQKKQILGNKPFPKNLRTVWAKSEPFPKKIRILRDKPHHPQKNPLTLWGEPEAFPKKGDLGGGQTSAIPTKIRF